MSDYIDRNAAMNLFLVDPTENEDEITLAKGCENYILRWGCKTNQQRFLFFMTQLKLLDANTVVTLIQAAVYVNIADGCWKVILIFAAVA